MIRLLALVICILFSFQNSVAQKLKKKSETNGLRKEIYHIDKKTKFKNGLAYIIRTDIKDTISIGNYKNSRRVGKWRFNDGEKGEPYIIYNYDNDSLLFWNTEHFADTFLINAEWFRSKKG
ncbi:hypothetical protein [Draconibacterium halophilum]|uniref:Nicotinic acid mononucleotide adenyltransferase n=1 Tax=Draconibacterium halophilum TaxID=2706887 RepID=A0A6C0RD53_9BACT|nr:hypothetical protein [Draconibacterium halophilum]QIA07832.1 hypothetical protein G0Q07_08870 [Draconibacterium halophilum]